MDTWIHFCHWRGFPNAGCTLNSVSAPPLDSFSSHPLHIWPAWRGRTARWASAAVSAAGDSAAQQRKDNQRCKLVYGDCSVPATTKSNMEDYLRRAKTMLVSFSLNSPGIIRVLLVGMMTTCYRLYSCCWKRSLLFLWPPSTSSRLGYGGRPEWWRKTNGPNHKLLLPHIFF